jgi:hypothetical protein
MAIFRAANWPLGGASGGSLQETTSRTRPRVGTDQPRYRFATASWAAAPRSPSSSGRSRPS